MVAWDYDKGRKRAEKKPSEWKKKKEKVRPWRDECANPRRSSRGGWGRVQDNSLALQIEIASLMQNRKCF